MHVKHMIKCSTSLFRKYYLKLAETALTPVIRLLKLKNQVMGSCRNVETLGTFTIADGDAEMIQLP